jgi:tRNA (guanine26-N2/guanine27-N2)-dimethyltransferase
MDLQQEGAITFETEGAFYNPKMKLNRDIGVAMTKALGISSYLDALSASGIRGLRVAGEAGVEKVALNDISPQACDLILKNIAKNNLTNCEALCCNANVLMHQRHFQAVDLDPFGSPSPFLTAGARSALSYLFVTATDTAPLCGAHLKSGIRKYMARPLRTDYYPEMGARILLGLACRELARLDKAMEPMLTHATDHYVRTYLRVIRGAQAADECLEEMGYVEHCLACGSFSSLREPMPVGICGRCGEKTVLAGPLWLGRIQEADVILQASANLEGSEGNSRAKKLLEACASELDVPFYYDHHRVCERLRITPGRIDSVVEHIRAQGWRASRTHFSGIGIKTDAPLCAVEEASRLG